MATTSPDNIWTPDAGDAYALTTDLAATADTVQDALNAVRAEQNALANVNMALYGNPGTDQSVADGSAANISTLIFATPGSAGFMTMSSGVLTCVTPGIYEIQWTVSFAATGSNQGAGLNRNSTSVAREYHGPWLSSWNTYGASNWVQMGVGDTIRVVPVLGSATMPAAPPSRLGWKFIRTAL